MILLISKMYEQFISDFFLEIVLKCYMILLVA